MPVTKLTPELCDLIGDAIEADVPLRTIAKAANVTVDGLYKSLRSGESAGSPPHLRKLHRRYTEHKLQVQIERRTTDQHFLGRIAKISGADISV